jgi:hypothetical protein
VLPSSHGFIAAGRFTSEGADHAGLAVSRDGTDWEHIQSTEFQGGPSGDRYLTSLAETSAGTVLAGGSVGAGQTSSGAVWRSSDTLDWRPVLLPRADGYSSARVVSLTAGPLRTVAIVQSRTTGQPARYSSFSTADDGLTWEHGTDLDAASADEDVSIPLLAVRGEGFVLAATRGLPGRHVPLLMASGDGKRFAAQPLDHSFLAREGLTLSAVGVSGSKLLLAGVAGEGDQRKAFGIAVDMPEP